MPSSRHDIPYRAHANRRRQTYNLTRQRYVFPLFLVAALCAVVVHLLIMSFMPELYDAWQRDARKTENPERIEDEEVRVVVREQVFEELPDAPDMPPPEEPEEIEEVLQEPVELDILDVDVQELVMAPGETNLPVPEPEPEQNTDAVVELAPAALDMTQLGTSALPDQAELIPEPTPINANDVVANATPQSKVLEDAEGLIESELRRQAKEGQGNLPGDTRSLADLMGVKNLGANSGVARLGTDMLFNYNQCKLKNSARISLLQLAALIHKNPTTRFIIEGHTDGIGGEAYNALLSLQRASAVCDWLQSNGVPIDNVYMRACGSSRPLVSTTASRDEQALNRRVEIHMRKADEALPNGCLPATYEVDRKTSVQTQLRRGVKAPSLAE